MEVGNDPDFGNTHGEALFEYYVRIEGEDVTRSVAQKELALWIHMVALELGKTKLAGEAGTYAKRLIDEGYDTVQGLAELDIEDLVEAGMRKGTTVIPTWSGFGKNNRPATSLPSGALTAICRTRLRREDDHPLGPKSPDDRKASPFPSSRA